MTTSFPTDVLPICPTPSCLALRVSLCNFGQEAGRPSLVDSVEKGRSRSKLRAGPERDGSFRELQAATAGTGIGRSLAILRRFLAVAARRNSRSEEHTSELQSLMRISYAVFCLKKKNTQNRYNRKKINRRKNNEQ